MYESCDRQSVFGFWILYRVPSDYWHVRFRSLFGATAEDLFQYALRQVFRECDDVQCRDGASPCSVDVTK